MQEVQTRIRLVAPAMTARAFCRLIFQRRLETLWAWLILCPNIGPRPHTSHTLAIDLSSETIQDNTVAKSVVRYPSSVIRPDPLSLRANRRYIQPLRKTLRSGCLLLNFTESQ